MFLKLSSTAVELTSFLLLRLFAKLHGLVRHGAVGAGLGAGNHRSCACAGLRCAVTAMTRAPVGRHSAPGRRALCAAEPSGLLCRGVPSPEPVGLFGSLHAALCLASRSPLSCCPCCRCSDMKNPAVVCVYSTPHVLVFGHFKPGILGLNTDGLQQ